VAPPLLLAGTFLLASCAGGRHAAPQTSPTPESPQAINLTAEDFSYKADFPRARAGTVHVALKNDSKTYQHEFWIYPREQPKLAAMIAQKDSGKANEPDFLQGIAGRIRSLDPGTNGASDIALTPGVYEYACFITENLAGTNRVHYELGMHGTLTVP